LTVFICCARISNRINHFTDEVSSRVIFACHKCRSTIPARKDSTTRPTRVTEVTTFLPTLCTFIILAAFLANPPGLLWASPLAMMDRYSLCLSTNKFLASSVTPVLSPGHIPPKRQQS
uniref:Protein kish n=1 Tax=Haemonchus placei TaxID=6290 RepID=A0A0N4X053_HAEPC